ncbi:MAG: hypothetical protein U0798_08130 [Gemmataceae bacterium]
MSNAIAVERRQQIFADVVAAQDEGLSVLAARAKISKQHELSVDLVKEIEREGIDNSWPPLGE